MFFTLFVILSVTLFVPLIGAVWLLSDWHFTKLVKKTLTRYQYHVVTVNETRRKFDLPEAKKPLISFTFTLKYAMSEQTQFREVTFTKGDQTYTCLAALKSAHFKKPVLFFDIDLGTLSPKVFHITDQPSLHRKTIL